MYYSLNVMSVGADVHRQTASAVFVCLAVRMNGASVLPSNVLPVAPLPVSLCLSVCVSACARLGIPMRCPSSLRNVRYDIMIRLVRETGTDICNSQPDVLDVWCEAAACVLHISYSGRP